MVSENTGVLPPCPATYRVFREISRKNEVVTGQGGKNPGFLPLVGLSNEAKRLIGLFIYVNMRIEKSREMYGRRFIFGCQVRNFRHFLFGRGLRTRRFGM